MSQSRSKKRGSSSAIPAGSLLKGVMLGLCAFVVSLVVVIFGLLSFAKSFIRGDRFREMLAELTAEPLKSQSTIESMTWEGTEAYASRFEAAGFQDAGFQRVEISGLRALVVLSLENFFNKRVWEIDKISVAQMDVHLNKDGRLAGTYAEAHPQGPVAEPSTRSGPDLGDLLPKEVLLHPVQISNANVYWTNQGKTVEATGIRTELEVAQEKSGLSRVKATGGTLQGAGIPKVALQELDFRWRGNDFYITKAEAFTEDGAKLNVDGDIRMSTGEMLVRANLTGLHVINVVADDWKKRVKGDIAITSTISGNPSLPDKILQKGTITVTDGVIESFPVLDILSQWTQAQAFQRVVVSKATADYTRAGNMTTVQNIVLQSDGLARLEGTLEITGDKLSGLLNLGVVPGTLKWIPEVERKVFLTPRDGHLWTEVKVGGTLSHPENDLVARMQAAGIQSALDMAQELAKDPAQLQDKAIEMGKGLLKSLLGE